MNPRWFQLLFNLRHFALYIIDTFNLSSLCDFDRQIKDKLKFQRTFCPILLLAKHTLYTTFSLLGSGHPEAKIMLACRCGQGQLQTSQLSSYSYYPFFSSPPGFRLKDKCIVAAS